MTDERTFLTMSDGTRIAASLHHPNIVAIHYAGEQDGLLFFVMDYVTGTDLREILSREHTLEPSRAVDLLTQLASALDAAHGRGLVHRDVKPANVLITVKDGEEHAYLTDFGLARKADNLSGLTVKGTVVGTVHYMAPEISTGNYNKQVDVYAAGVILYEMVTGKVPFDGESAGEILMKHLTSPPDMSRVPAEWKAVVAKALAKNPAHRYANMSEMARDVEAVTAVENGQGPQEVGVYADSSGGEPVSFKARLRIDTPREAEYFRHGGILQFVLRQLLAR